MGLRRRRLEGPPRLVFGGREPLVEEAPEQKDGAYCEERECTRHCAERRQVVEEDLGEADGEEGESRHPDRARASLQAYIEQSETESTPEGADGGVAALELGVEP